jgi:hypothetical protein
MSGVFNPVDRKGTLKDIIYYNSCSIQILSVTYPIQKRALDYQ